MTTRPNEDADAILELLPWYVAGTLGPADVKRVEDALARQPELRASLRLIEEEQDEATALNESLGAPSGAAWARVLATTQAEPRKPPMATRLAAFLGLGREPNARRLAAIAAAAALVIVLQGATIMSLLPESGPTYRTASETPAHGEGANVLIAFAPEARLDQVTDWLQAHHAVVVDGPRGGFYRLRVGDKALGKDEMAALVAGLSATPLARTVLPASGQ